MGSNFYQIGLLKYGIEVVTPTVEEQEIINRIIFSELAINLVSESSKRTFLKIISSYPIDSVILGCKQSQTKNLISKLYDGSVKNLAVSLFKAGEMSADDIEEIKKMFNL
ncbi:hypothetical protein [Anaerotignum sp.]|uniref:hypothetical protein n=1 Tax=Anaerotignum sp. TaxID=2039241 RepID=UPI00289A9396|nr:hypothetical protein [Anaerotignum sp.]